MRRISKWGVREDASYAPGDVACGAVVTERPYDVVTFDCYGTLIDWEAGITRAFAGAAARDGIHLDPTTLRDAYLATERLVEGETYRSYRDILVETARRVTARLGWPWEPARAG